VEKTLTPREVLECYEPHNDTIPSLLRTRRTARPEHEVVQFGGRSWTYAQFDQASDRLAAVVTGFGVRKGDRVAMISQNSDLSLVLFLALAKVGAVFVPLNPALTAAELEYILGHAEPRLVVVQTGEIERVRQVMATVGSDASVLDSAELGASKPGAADVIDSIVAHATTAESGETVVIEPNDPAVIIYTSGTTGFPKGVLHSHRNYVWAAEAFVERMHLQPSERLLTILPFFHINALFYSFGGALACGGTLITAPRFSASRFWDVAAECGATQFNILAAVGNILAKRLRSEFNTKHRITKIYGGPISAEMYRVFQEEFHVPDMIEGYGMSEIPGACNNPFEGPRKIGSIGKPARHPRFGDTFAQMKVIDEEDQRVPNGQVGELIVKTPIVMRGYFKDPEQTEAAFVDGWLRTGDLAWQDDEGYFYFVARKKDIIRRRGENISGAELDRVLLGHPDILEAATIGVPAELGEEEIMAVLVARPGQRPKESDLAEWCGQQLAAMKVPRYFVFVDALTHTSSHRVAKFKLKEDQSLIERAFDRERILKNP
jgi:crotonobetaine/carnitine-CoA ligase